jgi:hypothetical protein
MKWMSVRATAQAVQAKDAALIAARLWTMPPPD